MYRELYINKIRASKHGDGYDVFIHDVIDAGRIIHHRTIRNTSRKTVESVFGNWVDYLLTTHGEALGRFPINESILESFVDQKEE